MLEKLYDLLTSPYSALDQSLNNINNQTIKKLNTLYTIKNFTTPLEPIIEQLQSRAIPSAGSGIVRQTLQFGEHGKWSH